MQISTESTPATLFISWSKPATRARVSGRAAAFRQHGLSDQTSEQSRSEIYADQQDCLCQMLNAARRLPQSGSVHEPQWSQLGHSQEISLRHYWGV
jgi:hypothetical protein